MTKHRYANPALVPANLGADHRIRHALIVLPGYPTADLDQAIGEGGLLYRALGNLWRLFTTESYRQFVKTYRDFYANPRSPDYMAARTRELVAVALPTAKITLIAIGTNSLPAPLAEREDDIKFVSLPSVDQLRNHLSKRLEVTKAFDIVLLLHHDALGLGLDSIEQTLLKELPDRTFVMNGRRRVYRLDRDMQARLALRRFLASTRLIELVLSAVIKPTSLLIGRPKTTTIKI